MYMHDLYQARYRYRHATNSRDRHAAACACNVYGQLVARTRAFLYRRR